MNRYRLNIIAGYKAGCRPWRLSCLSRLAILFILSGCASLAPPRPPASSFLSSPPPYSERFHVVGTWTLEGSRKASGHFDWNHSPQEDELRLLGPFSLPIANITRHQTITAIQTAKGEQLTESQWESASAAMLGHPLSLPLQPLSAWIQGSFYAKMPPGEWLSDPALPALETKVRQADWLIIWSRQTRDHVRPDRVMLSPPQLLYRLLLDIDQESSAW
jgi:outer membrane biogenesis lipoprotein LolB